MIRQTLTHTQSATFCVLLPDPEHRRFPCPTGTGFFVSPDGWFVTAAHVVRDADGRPRADIEEAHLQGVPQDEQTPGMRLIQSPRLDFVDDATDIALLKLDFDKNAEKEWLKGEQGFPSIAASARRLEEGEPVYSFGFPLSSGRIETQGPPVTIMSTSFSPRVTSAVVASRIEQYGMIQSSADPQVYVLDKALNYGNSGGPIVATDTGEVHAVCTRFQPVVVPQPHIRDEHGNPIAIQIPSLYGVVSSLSDPRVIQAFNERDIAFAKS